jgi:hypothetical protein
MPVPGRTGRGIFDRSCGIYKKILSGKQNCFFTDRKTRGSENGWEEV